MALNHRHVEHLLALAEAGSFTGAARLLHVAQPAVSQTIRSLEGSLGVELFDRRAKHLTTAGEALARRARRARAELEAGEAEVRGLAGVTHGLLRVGAIHWLEPFDLTDALARFRRRHPGVRLSLIEADADVMLDRLQGGALDVVMHNRGPATDRPGTARRCLVSERIVVAVAPDHALASRTRVSRQDLAGQGIITFRSGSALRKLIDQAFVDEGIQLDVALESSDLLAVRSMAAHGLGPALVPASVARAAGPPIATVGITPAIEREVVLVWRTDHDPAPAVGAFLDVMLTGA